MSLEVVGGEMSEDWAMGYTEHVQAREIKKYICKGD